MHVSLIEFKNFFGASGTYSLPRTGLVVVHGRNGVGKTSGFLEPVVWGAFDHTLRGTSPLPIDTPKAPCSVRLVVERGGEQFDILRKFAGGKRQIHWNCISSPQKFLTNTKTNQGLWDAGALGDGSIWQQTHVFSGDLLTMFSLATDAERKRLLEALLGIAVFDGPLKEIGRDLDEAKRKLAAARAEVSNLVDRVEYEEKRVASMGGNTPDDPSLDGESVDERMARRAQLSAELQQHARRASDAQAELRSVAMQAAHVEDGRCRTCGQSIPHAHLAAHAKKVEELKARAQLLGREAAEKSQELNNELAELEHAINTINQARARREANRRLRTALQTSAKAIADMNSRLADLDFEVEILQASEQVLSYTERLFGTRGVRSRILGQALGPIQDAANAFLEHLHPDIKIELDADSDLKKGTSVEKIALTIHGRGGGHGYRALSKGERKRVDIALLLALASLGGEGTLFFDDTFDFLDEEGAEAVGRVLEELAVDRTVVVLTCVEHLAKVFRTQPDNLYHLT